MNIDFHPDFRIPPIFKAIIPKLKEMFLRLKFKPENYQKMMKRVLLILVIFAIAILIVIILIRII
jgi:hypothetical protein